MSYGNSLPNDAAAVSPGIQAGVPIPGQGMAVAPPRIWQWLEAGMYLGDVSSSKPLHVYVFPVADDAFKPGGTVSLSASDLHAHGVLPPGDALIQWQRDSKPSLGQLEGGGTVLDSFGPNQDGQTWGVVSEHPPQDLKEAGGFENVPVVLDHRQFAGKPGGVDFEPRRVGFERPGWWKPGAYKGEKAQGVRAFAGVQSILFGRRFVKRLTGMVFRPGEGYVPKNAPEAKDATLMPKWLVASIGRAMIPPQTDDHALADAHLHHGDAFSGPYRTRLGTAARYLEDVANQLNIPLHKNRMLLTLQKLNYKLPRRGEWGSYTAADAARIRTAGSEFQDISTAAQYDHLTPEQQRLLLPSITAAAGPGRSGRSYRSHAAAHTRQ